jgi:CheY-like chemotaxis protein
MSLILLADDSPHAIRMGEQILRGEGYNVVSVADGITAAARLQELDPELFIADYFLPGKSGLELCRDLKQCGRLTKVILTAGMLETLDESTASSAGSDAIVRKPFEATAVLAIVDRLAAEAQRERQSPQAVSADQVRALVEKALQAEIPRVIEEVTARVLSQLKSN